MSRRAGRRHSAIVLGALAVAGALLGEACGASAPDQLNQPTIAAPDGTFFFGLTPQFALSPDGQQVAFVAFAEGQQPQLWLRSVGSSDARALVGTEQASYPFWSPDGRSVGFFASGQLKTVPTGGGPPVVVCDAPTGRGGTWNDAGTIVFTSGIGAPLRQVSASGGVPVPATVLDTPRENSHRWPQFLPGGRHVLFWAGAGTAPPQLKVVALDSTDSVVLGPADSNGQYGGDHVFFKSGNTLMARQFNAATRETTGDPFPVADPISNDVGSFFASFSVSSDGTLAYVGGSAKAFVLTWFDRAGQRLGTVGAPGLYTNATLSLDGTRIAVSLTAGSPANRDIWIVDAADGTASRVTDAPAVDATPVWSPDGTEVVFSSQRDGPYQMYRIASTSAGATPTAELLLKSGTTTIATDWSTDGRLLAYTRAGLANDTPATGLDVWILPLSDGGPPIPVARTAAVEDNGAFSPDGRWIAYQSNESGRTEVYVTPTPAAGAPPVPPGQRGAGPPLDVPIRVSQNGGTQPRWRGDASGSELLFLASDGSVMAAAVGATGPFQAETPRAILPATTTLVIRHAHDVTTDGQRLLLPVIDQSNPSVITLDQLPRQ